MRGLIALIDEVLEEGGCALSVRDVSELLHAQYAIITGGKSREGCPILTFPDKGNFAQLGDEEYRKLIIYLTSVPSLQDADMGFVLVIDRRNDKWNSVKTVLLKISGFFPGLITVAYVLRPAGFFQKAISEVSNKIFRDEFKFRVVVCNCVVDLHEYIDKNQLTEDLDGCIPYNHDEWIEQRVRNRDRGRRTVTRSPRGRMFTGLDEAAVAHVRTLMDLINDISSSADNSEDIIRGDYILQIQIQHAVATLKQVQCRPCGRGAEGSPRTPGHYPPQNNPRLLTEFPPTQDFQSRFSSRPGLVVL